MSGRDGIWNPEVVGVVIFIHRVDTGFSQAGCTASAVLLTPGGNFHPELK